MQKVQKQRLIGLDLCRGLAAFAVIVVHSGDENWGVPVAPWADFFRLSFYFAVPFFLFASFYFMVQKPNIGRSVEFWKSRLARLAIPYISWCLIYLGLRVAMFSLSHKPERIKQLLEDPLSILFFGKASFHLYFLPLLIVGSFLLLFTSFFANLQAGIKRLLIFGVGSIVINEVIIAYGLEAQLNTTFNPFLRVLVMYGIWIFKCLPYFLAAILLNRLIAKKGDVFLAARPVQVSLFATFLITTIFGRLFLPLTLRDLIVATTLFMLGIQVSKHLHQYSQLLTQLGTCAFGIYLIHLIPKNVVTALLAKLGWLNQEVTIASILVISIATFFLSWLAISVMLKSKSCARYLLGV
jgi:fucose 4-O-acetylase-like acetyltransferase